MPIPVLSANQRVGFLVTHNLLGGGINLQAASDFDGNIGQMN